MALEVDIRGMPVVAKLKYLRIAPRKVRLVADLIRGKSVEQAQTLLHFTVKKANEPLLKLLKSAIASARNNFQLQESNLYICKISVDEGPKYKRYMPRARGQAYEIQKKTSHVTLWLDEIVKKPPKESKLSKGQAKKVEKIKKVDEAGASSSPFANARVVDEAGASSSPFANARVTEKYDKIEEKISKVDELRSSSHFANARVKEGGEPKSEEKMTKKEKIGLKPTGIMTQKPKIVKGIKRIFKRKSF